MTADDQPVEDADDDDIEYRARCPSVEGTSAGTSRLLAFIEVMEGDGWALLAALEKDGDALSRLSHSSLK